MKKSGQKYFTIAFWALFSVFIITVSCFAQDSGDNPLQQLVLTPAAENQPAPSNKEDLNVMEKVSLDFKDADIRSVLKIISIKNI